MQTTTPTSHHSVFYRPDALPDAQPTASKHWRQMDCQSGYFRVQMICMDCNNIVHQKVESALSHKNSSNLAVSMMLHRTACMTWHTISTFVIFVDFLHYLLSISTPVSLKHLNHIHVLCCNLDVLIEVGGAFSALTVLVRAPGRASGLLKLSDEVLVWLSVWSRVQMICMWSSRCHCHLCASLRFRLILSLWYQLTQFVLKNRLLNGCSIRSRRLLFQVLW